MCGEGGQRGPGKAFWKRQSLSWVLKGDGIGCAGKAGNVFQEAGVS